MPYDPPRTFGYALWVGFLNTLKVSIVGIVLATFLGLGAALARLSTNWLVSNIAALYINIIRNIPLLVQLFIWYFAVFQKLPPVQQALTLPGPIYISQRGLYMVGPQPTATFAVWLLFVAVGLVLGYLLHRYLLRYQVRTGRSTYPDLDWAVGAGGRAAGGLVPGWRGAHKADDRRSSARFNFEGGM